MKCKVRLTRTVEMYVEGKDADAIMDWLRGTTPEEAYQLANGSVDEYYDEEIVCQVNRNTIVNYTIQND